MKFHFSFKEYDPKAEAVYGTILTLGNGYIGIRGEIELEPTIYGTTIAGVYDYAPYFYREIVNAPRVIGLQIFFNGEPISLSTQKILKYERELNIEDATLKTLIAIETQSRTRIEYESIRIVHGKIKNLILLKFKIKANEDGMLTIISPIKTNVVNPSYRNEIMVKHLNVMQMEDRENEIYAEVETLDGRYRIGIASSLISGTKAKRAVIKSADGIAEILTLSVKKNKTYEFIKYITILSSKTPTPNLREAVLQKLQIAKNSCFSRLYEEHKDYWKEIWKRAKIEIEGDKNAENGLNFSIFHLIQSMPIDSRISLTARGIHGFGYRGHIFWDTEIYALPFFMAVFPEKAREMLMYRYNNLNAARENAKMNGYSGAQFPWESADDGYEATPSVIPLDMMGKKVVKIYTGEEEHHITADIAYAVELYYKFTGDEEFMFRYGLEIILETARFWASRVEYDEKKGYVIKKVIGPDEYHEHVDNSFFTNLMARYNLLLAVKYFKIARRSGGEWSKTLKRINITEKEVQRWLEIAEKIYIPRQKNGVFEEFEGYFDLSDYTLDPYGLGEKRLPEEIRRNLRKTKIIKQADVIAAQYLLKDQFDLETIRKNFDYYIIRTTHASSLSMPPYAIVASWLDYEDLAYDYFMKCAFIDLHNLYGNTQDGFHLATAGGVWQIIFRGLCGIDINNEGVEINPKLPKKWKAVRLRFFFKKALLSLEVRKDSVRVKLLKGEEVKIRAFGRNAVVKRGKETILHK
ncbi:glycoside hydrolase family 65 protein [Thermococcus barophilus]|uniref:Maltose phosphorylase n=1 Tax=Thermococcus barophilus (strain DSM 11836 / MP) TaxID=391623 RepID=F0LIH8_THEBM|nr:glycosyl hydrolase family 65 protein [Thermococcus barophilus]ADT83252.1 maltose phosphorylase [Thermococcus barophilus MP]